MIVGHRTIVDPNDVSPGLLLLEAGGGGDPADHTKTYVNLDDSKELLNNHWGGGTVIEERNIPVVFEDIYTAQQQQEEEDKDDEEFVPDAANNGRRMTRSGCGVGRAGKTATAARRPGRRSTTGVKEEDVSPEEREKLLLRRERNKEAAARCRKRKLDQIESLEKQVGEWEEKNSALQRELIDLRAQHSELQVMLHEHNKICRLQQQQMQSSTAASASVNVSALTTRAKVAKVSHPQIQQQQNVVVVSTAHQQQQQQQQMMWSDEASVLRVPAVSMTPATMPAATTTTINNTTITTTNNNNSNNKVVVKTEDCELAAERLFMTAGLLEGHQTTEEYLNQPQSVAAAASVNGFTGHLTSSSGLAAATTVPAAAVAASTAYPAPTTTTATPLGQATAVASTFGPVTAKRSRPSRPVSLSLSVGAQNLRSIEGVPIETPTNIFSQLNFDALMDGRTGLTPTNILTPVAITMGGAAGVLSTPVLASPTCSSQQQRSSGLPGPDKGVELVSL